MKWIKCSDKLPNTELESGDDLNECLVKDEDGDMGVGFYREDAHAWDSCSFGWLEVKDKMPRDEEGNLLGPQRLGTIVEYIPISEIKKAVSLSVLEQIKSEIQEEIHDFIKKDYMGTANGLCMANAIIDKYIKEHSDDSN